MCTMAWAAEAAVDALGGDPGQLRRIKVRFSRIVKIDDTVTFTATVQPGTRRVLLSAVNQEGQEVLKAGEAEGDRENAD